MRARLRSWLQLLRAPNLFTVAGDPLAGFLLANFGVPTTGVLPALGASLCFYGAGLLHNDLVDLAEDREERPDRPLPRGAASPRAVWLATLALCLIGIILCAVCGSLTTWLGAALVTAVGAYNQKLKKIPLFGALSMGTCRALSLLLGASAAPARAIPPDAWVCAVLLGLYIAAVTHLARFETRRSAPALARWLPGVVLGAMIATLAALPPMGAGASAVLGGGLCLGLLAILCSLRLCPKVRKWRPHVALCLPTDPRHARRHGCLHLLRLCRQGGIHPGNSPAYPRAYVGLEIQPLLLASFPKRDRCNASPIGTRAGPSKS